MANAEHVEIVMSGSRAIAEWREANRSESLDVIAANLNWAGLIGADLREADLEERR